MKRHLFIINIIAINISSICAYGSEERAAGTFYYDLQEYTYCLGTNTAVFLVDYVPGPKGMITYMEDMESGYYKQVWLEFDGKLSFSKPLCFDNRIVSLTNGRLLERLPVYELAGGIDPLNEKDVADIDPLINLGTSGLDINDYFIVGYGEGSAFDLLDIRFIGPFPKSERQQIKEMLEVSIKEATKESSIEHYRKELLSSDNKWIAILGVALLSQKNGLTAIDCARSPSLISSKDAIMLEMLISCGRESNSHNDFSEALCFLMKNDDVETADTVLDLLIDWTKYGAYGSCTAIIQYNTVLSDMKEAIIQCEDNRQFLLQKIDVIQEQVDSFAKERSSKGSGRKRGQEAGSQEAGSDLHIEHLVDL
ncbi:MAG: hypothetical protein JXR23_01940 [Pontiellaceae bacterium]|nr:hypothetical protein [Pontiellaceae bacterium]